AELHECVPRIDVLINNAGGIFARRELTVDGIEKTFATNYLAPFLLTHLLLDRVRAAPAGRIVNIASALHGADRKALHNLQGEKHYNFMRRIVQIIDRCNLTRHNVAETEQGF